MMFRVITKKKKFLPYKNLGELYVEGIKGQPSITRHACISLIKEMSKTAITKDIISKAPLELKAGQSKHGDIRLLPIKKDAAITLNTPEKQMQVLQTAGYNVIKTVPPKAPGSRSSRFVTYVILDKDNIEHYIVFGVGSNKGEDFEKEALATIARAIGAGAESEIINSIKFYLPGTTIVDVKAGFGRRVIRPFDLEPHDVGNVISDLTLIDQDSNSIYISIKNINGATLSNQGILGAFSVENLKLKYNFNKNIVLDLLFDMLNVDQAKMINGFNDYISENVTKGSSFEKIKINKFVSENIKDIIGSAIGYGYYYAREEKDSKVKVSDITTTEKLYKFIGDIESVSLQYPYFKAATKGGRSKSMIIKIKTSRHAFVFLVRNNSGGVIPNVINLKKV